MDLGGYDDELISFTVYVPIGAFRIENENLVNIREIPILFIDDFDATSGKPFAFKIKGE